MAAQGLASERNNLYIKSLMRFGQNGGLVWERVRVREAPHALSPKSMITASSSQSGNFAQRTHSDQIL